MERLLPDFIKNPELVPLGVHSPDMPHALGAARKVLATHPDIEAIMVNADPFAASLVGVRLARTTGLPLIQDFRDIWAPCKLRRPRRPLPWLALIDRLERTCFEAAAHVLINTEVSLRDYHEHYPDLPTELFSVLRNHFDAELVSHGQHEPFDRYTILHLGQFSRFRVVDPLVKAVAKLVEGGIDRDALQVVSTGQYGDKSMELAEQLGVRALFSRVDPVSYHEVGALLAAADLPVMIAEPAADQRIASKFYDYLGSKRPMLAISDNPESASLLKQCDGSEQFGHADIDAIAAFIGAQMKLGRQREVERTMKGLRSREATEMLVEVLERVTVRK